jgi:hypothetical protein
VKNIEYRSPIPIIGAATRTSQSTKKWKKRLKKKFRISLSKGQRFLQVKCTVLRHGHRSIEDEDSDSSYHMNQKYFLSSENSSIPV